jgi:hypothetical protein
MSILDPTDPRLIAGDVDFYCAGCGYNLRGLAGDPKRCPECGQFNPIELLIIPAEAIRKALRRLETAPTVAFMGLLMLVGAALLLRVSYTPSAILGVFAAACTLVGVSGFAHECQYRAGWFGALLWYFLYGTLLLAAGIGMPIALLWAGGLTLERAFRGTAAPCVWLVIAVVVATIPAVLSVRVLYRAAQRVIRELQRETAVRMAQQAHRHAIARRMRK